jgi:tol-pal system protein YbgF
MGSGRLVFDKIDRQKISGIRSMLKRYFKPCALALLAAAILFAGIGAGAPGALAQDRKLEDVLNKLQRLERDMRALNRQVHRGAQPAPADAPSAARPAPGRTPASAPPGAAGARLGTAYVARIEARLSDLENEIRAATGNIENFNHTMTQLSSRLDKLVTDMELRLSDLEKRLLQASVRAPSPARAGAPSQAPLTPPQISGVPRAPGVQQVGPTTGGASFARPAQSLGSISQGDLDAVKKGRASVAGQQAAMQPLMPPPPPVPHILPKGTPQVQYRFAQDLVHRAEYEKAARAFQEFIDTHPKHKLIANARYWLGRTYYVRRDYRAAAEAFLEGFRGDPEGNKAPDNLLSLGMSLSYMDKKSEACAMFGKLTSDFPDAPGRIKRLLARERTRADCG